METNGQKNKQTDRATNKHREKKIKHDSYKYFKIDTKKM